MQYAIIETPSSSKQDFEVHREQCSHHKDWYRTILNSSSAESAAEKFMQENYTDMDLNLGFGTYKIMPCAKEEP